jgi:glycosyltransferase involved in cell wall biosynthesis
MRICVVADSASVRFGGEAILPYHYFRMLRSRGVDAWLVVHDRTRPELEASLPEYRDRILYTPDLWLHRVMSQVMTVLPRRIAESSIGLLSVLLTQYHQRRVIRELVWREGIDVVHQPTPVSPRMPSMMFNLGAPVVIGPLNGGMHYPAAFRGQESKASHLAVAIARSLSNIANRLLPGKPQAAMVLVANQRTRESLPTGLKGQVIELVENAVDLDTWLPETMPLERVPGQFLFIGRLVDWKRVDIALHALARAEQASLLVVGDGEMRAAWEQLSRDLKLGDRVSFVGWKPHDECARLLAQSAGLILPSVYECGGAVVLEAMASARPVIATGWGGPMEYLDERCGILVAPESTTGMVERFAAGMALLATQPEVGDRMGAAGQARVQEHFSWVRKIDRIEEIYSAAVIASAKPVQSEILAT